MFITEESTRTY